MNYKYLVIKNNLTTNSDPSDAVTINTINPKYQKLLNNLLGIKSRGDAAVFTVLNNFSKDLTVFLDARQINTIFNNVKFKLELNLQSAKNLYELINELKTVDELINLTSMVKLPLTLKEIADLQTNPENLQTVKEELLTKIDNKKFVNKNQWLLIKKRINEVYKQTNTWPYYLGLYFLSVTIDNKTIYAPLVLKPIDVKIEGNRVFISSLNDTVLLNDKLTFILEQYLGVNLPVLNEEVDEIVLTDLINELDDYLANVVNNLNVKLDEPFEVKSYASVKKSEGLEKRSGLVSLFAEPAGGPLRRTLLELIRNNQMENLVYVDPNHLLDYKVNSIKDLIEVKKPIWRLCPTDASQEKAILSALNNDSILIGPPGTGKSQTIANILANIMVQNKTALFISQKKVALKVVLERLQTLQAFVLQLFDKKDDDVAKDYKKDFYENLNQYFDQIQGIELNSNDEVINSEPAPKPLISSALTDYWYMRESYLNQLNDQQIVTYSSILKNSKITTSLLQEIEELYQVLVQNNSLPMVKLLYQNQIRQIDAAAQMMQVQKKGFLKKKYPDNFLAFFSSYEKVLLILQENNLTLDLFIELGEPSLNVKIKEFFVDYQVLQKPLPNLNTFTSDLDTVLEIVKKNTRKRVNELNTQGDNEIRKLLGKIDREFLTPERFLVNFSGTLKKIFSVVASTPDKLASFVDFRKDHYDYVIFDEASQMFVEKSLPYISIADHVIIAGDNQQMQPVNWFNTRDETDLEEDEKIDSLLDWAIDTGLPMQLLELNYRATSASLTSFSSKEFYESDLKTLDTNHNSISAPIEVINVNGVWKNNMNEQEAEEMVQVLKDSVNKYEKIILLTLNVPQMQLVSLLLQNNEPDLYEKVLNNEVILKNLENIQGDEADLVIISIAYTKEAALAGTYVGRNGGRNALNVAITRAREKMIVLKSINSSDLDLTNSNNLNLITFKHWLNYLELSQEQQKMYAVTTADEDQYFDSKFEVEVYNWLTTIKFKQEVVLKTQYGVGSYRIDLAFLDAKTNHYLLGLEVDGFRYHSTVVQKYHDIVRQNFLEAKDYKIIRISEILWRTNKQEIINLINQALN